MTYPMTDTSSNAAPGALIPSQLVPVERAAEDLRRGLPAVVAGGSAPALIALSPEGLTEEKFDTLCTWSGTTPHLALTHNRAETLKIRLYTPDVVLVRCEDHMTPEIIRDLADPAKDLSRPLAGPFEAERTGAEETHAAAVKLAKIAQLLPAALVAPVPPDNDTGNAFAATRPYLSYASVEDIFGYDVAAALTLEQVAAARVPLDGAENTRLIAFRPRDGRPEHIAIVIGEIDRSKPVLIRIHSECFTGDLIGSLKCDCGQQLRGAIDQIGKEGSGILLYLQQEGRGIGLINKLRAYALQDQGFDTVEANERLGFESDERIFLPAVEMLRQLGVAQVRLMTNNPDKVEGLSGLGVDVVERVPHAFPTNEHNAFYLSVKRDKTGHLL